MVETDFTDKITYVDSVVVVSTSGRIGTLLAPRLILAVFLRNCSVKMNCVELAISFGLIDLTVSCEVIGSKTSRPRAGHRFFQ